MFEAVHALPDGESTTARFASTAREHGYDGIVVRNHSGDEADHDPTLVRDVTGVDVVMGVEIRATDPTSASSRLGAYRDVRTIVAVHGGTNAMNRFAVEQDRVDVLSHPVSGGGEFNHVLAREAARNGVRIEFNFEAVLRASGGRRVRALSKLSLLRRLIEQYDVPFVVSVDPFSHLQLRSPRELVALGGAIGFSSGQIESGLAEWGRLAARNRERTSETFIEPGVELGPSDEEDR